MIGVYINWPTLTTDQYHSIAAKIQEEGISEAGLKVHTCFKESGDALAIFDVWESEEAFNPFGAQLAALVERLGLPAATPHLVEMVGFALG